MGSVRLLFSLFRVFDVGANLRLVPKFNEGDLDTFFTLFERVAEMKGWPDEDRTLMLQCVLTGKAQEAYSALSATDCLSYAKVKSGVLKAYELVPEAYRQKFRNWVKGDKQTNVELARDLLCHFNRWCAAADVDNFHDLRELIVLEQFKNSIPQRIATYIAEQKATTVLRADELADDFALTHIGGVGDACSGGDARRKASSYGNSRYGNQSPAAGPLHTFRNLCGRDDISKVCNYCRESGHWKDQCPVLSCASVPGLR